MTPFKLMSKTMKFVWLKLGIGLAITVVAALLLALCMWIGGAFGGIGTTIMFCIWLVATNKVYQLVMGYVGYMIKAGHVAVIAHAVTTGQLPANQYEFGVQKVKARFAAANVYFLVDKLVTGSVKQLQKAVGKVGDALSAIPGMEAITDVLQTFIGIALGYIDECCIGWCFLNEDKGAFHASCDGVAIYFQNIKKLLKSAAVTTLIVILATAVAWVVPFAIMMGLANAFDWSATVAVVIALLIALVLKAAFIDTYMMIKMMYAYMQVAPQTEITFDIYGKLCKLSGKFKELFGKAESDSSFRRVPEPAMATAAAAYSAPVSGGSAFCPNCGAKSDGSKFCGNCGNKMY